MNKTQKVEEVRTRKLKALKSDQPHAAAISDIKMERVLDRHAMLMLSRLLNGCEHGDPLDLFAVFKVDYLGGRKIIDLCIEAERINRRIFAERVQSKKAMSKRLYRLVNAIEELKTFAKEIEAGPADPLDAYIHYHPDDLLAAHNGLCILEDAIAVGMRLAVETPKRLGATRKSGIKEAATSAALGWLAEGVLTVSGQPHHEEIASLANLVFYCEIFTDRVKEAARTRRDHPWH